MPHDPVKIGEARSRFEKAAQDLRAAAHDLRADPPLIEPAVFHCQQATEKAMKGFLTWHDQPFRKTHDLVEIGKKCASLDPGLDPVLSKAAPLTEYAWRLRYPGDVDEPPLEEAQEALETARKVFDEILARLPEDLKPPARAEEGPEAGPTHG